MSKKKEVLVPKSEYEDIKNKPEEEKKKILKMIDEGGPVFLEKKEKTDTE